MSTVDWEIHGAFLHLVPYLILQLSHELDLINTHKDHKPRLLCREPLPDGQAITYS